MEAFWSWLENLPLAMHIGETWWFPLLESIHILTATFVLGSIAMVDVRLLGLAGRSYAVTRLSNEIVPWTWGAFVIAAISGVGMFITRASAYVANPAFLWKVALLVLAGINMTLFHFLGMRSVAKWDTTPRTTSAARAAGASSLAIWAGIMLAGRWVGHLQ
jgi:hypothetical protein